MDARWLRNHGEGASRPRRYTDFRAMKWSKLLFNILGNPQSAILDLPPSHVFADSELFRYERAAFREATAVMDRMRPAAGSPPRFPAPNPRRALGPPPPPAHSL